MDEWMPFYAQGMERLYVCVSVCGRKTWILAITFEEEIETFCFGMHILLMKPFQMTYTDDLVTLSVTFILKIAILDIFAIGASVFQKRSFCHLLK